MSTVLLYASLGLIAYGLLCALIFRGIPAAARAWERHRTHHTPARHRRPGGRDA